MVVATEDIRIPAVSRASGYPQRECALKAGESLEVVEREPRCEGHVPVLVGTPSEGHVCHAPTRALMLRNVGSAAMCVGDRVWPHRVRPQARDEKDKGMRATPELAGTNGKWGTVVKVENFTMSEPVLYTVKLDSGLVHAYPRHWLNPAVLSTRDGDAKFVRGAPLHRERCNILKHVVMRIPQHIDDLSQALRDIRAMASSRDAPSAGGVDGLQRENACQPRAPTDLS